MIGNVYNRVGQCYYGFVRPPLRIDRRQGKPRNQHNAELCQACKEGLCKEEWAVVSSWTPPLPVPTTLDDLVQRNSSRSDLASTLSYKRVWRQTLFFSFFFSLLLLFFFFLFFFFFSSFFPFSLFLFVRLLALVSVYYGACFWCVVNLFWYEFCSIITIYSHFFNSCVRQSCIFLSDFLVCFLFDWERVWG